MYIADNPEKSLTEQARIVANLDKFDALTEYLPREIELRQKQYEYYRDLLLSFRKPDEATAGDGSPADAHAQPPGTPCRVRHKNVKQGGFHDQ